MASFAWHDVRCSYVDKRGQEKEVLHGVSGYLDGGHMLAVIGTPWHAFRHTRRKIIRRDILASPLFPLTTPLLSVATTQAPRAAARRV